MKFLINKYVGMLSRMLVLLIFELGYECYSALSTIYELYRGSQFYFWGTPKYPVTASHQAPTSKFYQLDFYHIGYDCFLNLYYVTASWNSLDFLDRGLLLTRKLLNQGFLLVKLNSSLRKIYGHHHDLVERYGISVSQMTMDMFHLPYHSRSFPHSWLITGFVTRLTRRVSLVEHELLTLPEHLSSTPVFVGFVLLNL